MTTVRNITKNGLCMEDISQGVGTEVQTRNETDYTVGLVDVPYAVTSVVAMQALDVTVFSRARVYLNTSSFADYIYDATDATGILPDTGPGSWLFVSITAATTVQLAAIGDVVNTVNKYAGKQVWDSTVTRPVWAADATAGGLWLYADGTTAVTPV